MRPATSGRILIVDDEPDNVHLLRRFLSDSGYGDVQHTMDPRQAMVLFNSLKPDLVLLDLHMPVVDGYTLLQQMDAVIPAADYLPIIVLTADASADAKRRALALGATDFLTKPLDLVEVGLRISNLLTARLTHLELEDYRNTLEDKVAARTSELEESQREIVARLALAAEYRDDYTGRHTRRVGDLSGRLAGQLGMSADEVDVLRMATPLHDIGKIAIPDSILLKPGPLTAAEFEAIRQHAQIGARLLAGSNSPILQMAEVVALAHHERWDGTGYMGLVGEAIPLVARIVSVADVYDALTHQRPYKRAWPQEKAVREIRNLRTHHFDPVVVDAFIELISEDV
jgi:putative two-component system response regulator